MWNVWNVLTRMQRRKRILLYIGIKDDQATTSTKFLSIEYKFYGSSGYLTKIINLGILLW